MRFDLRLALPAAAAWGALAILIGAPDVARGSAVAFWILALGLVALARVASTRHWRLHNGVLLSAALAAALSGLMLTSAAIAQPERQPPGLVAAATSGAQVQATAYATQTLHDGQRRFDATLAGGGVGGQEFDGSIPVLVFGSVDRSAGIGSELRMSGTLDLTDPGDGTAFLFFLDSTAEVVAGPPWYLDWAGGLRSGFLAAATSLPGDGGALLPGLSIGDTSAVGNRLDSAMKASALSHLTAVSGANCAVIIGLVMFGGAAFGMRRGWRIAISLVVLVGFVVLVTPEPSVLRAGVMATLALIALGSGRPVRGVPVLALAVSMLLVFDPWLARNYGFVLSVCATAGLLLLAGPMARALSRWVPFWLALLIAVPAAAQLACQPVLILLSPTIPTYGVVANILAGAAAPLATVLGLAACVVLAVLPAVGALVVQLAWLPSAWIAAVATFFSSLPLAALPWPAGSWGVALMALISALGLVVWRAGAGTRWRLGASALLLVFCVGYLGIAGGEQLRRRLAPPADWGIAACDVGQGDAMLVRSTGRIALIDTGPEPAALGYCLDTLAIAHIDLLVLTHFDLDHVGGTDAVIGLVDRVLVGPSAGPEDDAIVQRLADAGAAVEQVSRGLTGVLGDLRWQVLWPPQRLGGIEPGNEASVAMQFSGQGECTGGCLRSVFLGDLGEEAQQRLLAMNRLGAVDAVKVSHHGSRDQSAALYQRLQAAVGLIGVGADNDYGHPTDDILRILASTGTAVARTDADGLALVSIRDGVIHLWTERTDDSRAE